jgi:ketosteroid isomerase-like protein
MIGDRGHRAETIARYHDACSAGDAEAIAALCSERVVHYFTDPTTPPVRGAEHLGRYWRKVRRLRRARWRLERVLVGDGDDAAIEWTLLADGPDGRRTALHGTEWYRFEGGLIAEIRAYFNPSPDGGGLAGFPYRERGYATAEASPGGPAAVDREDVPGDRTGEVGG